MKRWRGTALILCLALLAPALGGCGAGAGGAAGDSGQAVFQGMEPTPRLEYEVPVSLPGILTDRVGYQAGGNKIAAIRGRRLPATFRLVDRETGQTVYTGNIEKITYEEEHDLYTGYGDFSAYDMEGEYYLECGIVGRSYPFKIGRELYRERFLELLGRVTEELDAWDGELKDSESEILLKQVHMLLLSYELSPGIYEDMDGNGIPEALDVAARQVEKLRAGREASGELPPSALYSAVLAKFCYLYQKFDVAYAKDCLKDAAGVFAKQRKERPASGGTLSDSPEDARTFWALAELYRATGTQDYRWKIREYQDFFEGREKLPKEQGYLFGAMTYLCTRQKVEKGLCDVLMDKLLEEGERIDEEADTLLNPFSGENTDTERLLEKATVLIFTNFVLVNYKYDITLEEMVHYLAGRNPQAQAYCGFEDSDAAQTRYLLLLGQITNLYSENAQG